MGTVSTDLPPQFVGELAATCATQALDPALDSVVASLRRAGVPVAAWRRSADGWQAVAGTTDAPAPDDAAADRWTASEVRVDDAAVAVLMLASDQATDAHLLDALASLLTCAAQRDAVQKRLDTSEQRFADNQRLSGVGSYDWHIASDTNIWTDTLFRIYGCEPGSFHPTYQEFLDRIHPDDREHIKAVHAKAYEEGGRYEMHERIVWPDGTIRTLWSMGEVIVDADGTPVRMVGVCEDVTDKLLEQERSRRVLASLAKGDAERAAALELNDNVVQGLTAVAWALDAKRTDKATEAAHNTLQAARDMMDRLLNQSKDQIAPGDLVRTSHAPRVTSPDPDQA